MRKTILCVSLMVLGSMALPARAQAFKQGDWAMTLSGGGDSTKEFKDSVFSLNVAPGYFVTDQVEVGLRQTGSYAGGFSGATTPFADFNIEIAKNWVPYVGANIGYSYGHDTADAWRAGPEAGLRYFVNTTTYIEGNIAYEFDLNNGINSGGWLYNVGIGFKW